MQEKFYEEGVDYFKQKDYIKAIEKITEARVWALINKDVDRKELCIRDIGRAYLYLFRYEDAYEIFQELAEESDNSEIIEYSISRIGIISAELGDYMTAAKIFEALPTSSSNLLNKAMFYYHLYFYEKEDYALKKAEMTLTKIDEKLLTQEQLRRLNTLYGMVNQRKKNVSLAEKHYRQAINLAEEKNAKARTINDLASLFIDTSDLEEASNLLDEAFNLIGPEGNAEILGYNYNWRAVIEDKKGNYRKAAELFIRAAEILQEKNIYKRLAELSMRISELENNDKYEAAKLIAEGINFRQQYREVRKKNEKIHSWLDSSFGLG